MSKKLLALLFILVLSGCKNEEYSKQHLLTHPLLLKRQVARCEKEDNTAYCEQVLFTAATFMSLLNEQEDDPEAFGDKVLRKEMECAKIKTALAQSQQAQASKTSVPAEVDLEKTHKNLKKQIAVLLAVIGVHRPE